MEQIFLFKTIKNPTSTREAGKNNIKIMKKIRRLNYILNAVSF